MNFRVLPAGLCAALLAACSTTLFAPQPLRVGFTPDRPPYIFLKEGKAAGVEADFAQRLALSLDRPVEFVQLRPAEQYAALVVNQVDILMTGLSAPHAAPNIVFTHPYSTNGPRVWAVRSATASVDMLAKINRQLAAWYADGTINRVLGKWDLPPTAPKHAPVVAPPPSTNAAPAALTPGRDAATKRSN